MRVVTFGETMLRLSPPGYQRLVQAESLQIAVAGTESNTAALLAQLGVEVVWLSRLPDNPLGRIVAQRLRAVGVDISHVVWDKQSRMGLCFVEMGATPRPTRVFYDRKDSAMSRWQPGEWNWCDLLSGANLLHATGITPALSPSCYDATVEALQAAHRYSVPVSFDLNYRSTLWEPQDARQALEPLLKWVHLLFVSPADARTVLGAEGTDESIAKVLQERYHIPVVVTPIRLQQSNLRGRRYSIVATSKGQWRSEGVDFEVLEPIGSGDAYNAGFIYGYLQGDIQGAMRYADLFSALKHTVPGDILYLSQGDVEVSTDSSKGIVR